MKKINFKEIFENKKSRNTFIGCVAGAVVLVVAGVVTVVCLHKSPKQNVAENTMTEGSETETSTEVDTSMTVENGGAVEGVELEAPLTPESTEIPEENTPVEDVKEEETPQISQPTHQPENDKSDYEIVQKEDGTWQRPTGEEVGAPTTDIYSNWTTSSAGLKYYSTIPAGAKVLVEKGTPWNNGFDNYLEIMDCGNDEYYINGMDPKEFLDYLKDNYFASYTKESLAQYKPEPLAVVKLETLQLGTDNKNTLRISVETDNLGVTDAGISYSIYTENTIYGSGYAVYRYDVDGYSLTGKFFSYRSKYQDVMY